MLPKEQTFRIGDFEFSRVRGLYRAGRPVALRHLERQLLKCLLDRPGEIVRKEEIIVTLWPDSVVSANTLNVHVHRLRETLGDTKRPHRFLKSYPRMGFLLVATPTRTRIVPPHSQRTGDKSLFIRDVTVPDGAILEPGERFEKVWEIQNAGSRVWRNRFLRRVGASSGPGRLASDPQTPVPTTKPGQLCLIRMQLKAPSEPGSYYAAWKMVDEGGRECFPKMTPLFVAIDVMLSS